MKSNKKYIILLGCFLLQMFPYSIVNTVQSLFLAPVIREYHFSNGAFSLTFTISAFTVAICSPICGILLRKFPIKWIMTISALLSGLGFASFGLATKLSHFYLIAIIVSIGTTGLTMIPVATMISSFFEERKGTILGIAFAGTGFGTVFWMQIVSRLLDRIGIQNTYLVLGLLILIVSLPITIFIVEKGPLDRKNQASVPESKNKSFRKESGNLLFLCFAIGLFLMGIAISGTKVHVQPYLNFSGYTTTFSANVGSLLALAAVIGNVITGMVIDKIGLILALVFYGVLTFFSMFFLQLIYIPVIPFIFAICFGACLSLPSLLPSYGVSKLFAKRSYSLSLGICNAFFTIGAAIGPSLTGYLADSTYGYKRAFLIYSVIVVLYTILLYRIMKQCQKGNQSLT